MHRNLLQITLVFATLFSFSSVAQETITLEDVMRGTFFGRSPEAFQSMPDGIHYTMVKSDDSDRYVVKYDFASGDSLGVVFSMSDISEVAGKEIPFSTYTFNSTQDKVVIGANIRSIYRRSTIGEYYVYDLTNKSITAITDGRVQYPSLSPDGSMVAFVRNNNLFRMDLSTREVAQITDDGEENNIINGSTDWVYEEEFAFTKAFWWSPNSEHIAFLRFDESEVPTFSMDVYGNELYPQQEVFKYPKAGEKNAVVTFYVHEVTTGNNVTALDNIEYEYIPRVAWNPENEAIVFTSNRHQNKLVLYTVEPDEDYEVEEYLTETDSAYVEVNDNFTFTTEGDLIFTSERDGYNHIYITDEDGEEVEQITRGAWDVSEVYGTDDKYVYFQAAAVHPSQQEVYRARISNGRIQRLSTGDGTAGATFSEGMQYYMLSFQNINTPAKFTMHEADGTELRVLEDNAALIERMSNYHYSPKEFFFVETEDGVELSAWMIKPHDFDETKEYPLLMFVYGGPGSQTVNNNWDAYNGMYYQYLASQGYIIASVDNRGTGMRGRDFKKITYQQLGHYETIDQIGAAKAFGEMDFIDEDRIGIWGWSYGGYMSSNCLAKGADVFKMAIAVAPVTNWRFYDSIYTERYMRTPQENASGYDDNSPINHVRKITGDYLLIHGSADDNVHVQNTTRMVEALVQANVQFDLFIYPDKNHGIYGGMTRYHLYTKMSNFIQENL